MANAGPGTTHSEKILLAAVRQRARRWKQVFLLCLAALPSAAAAAPVPGLSLVWPLSIDTRTVGRDYAAYVSVSSGLQYHTGMDLTAAVGTTVRAAATGYIVFIQGNDTSSSCGGAAGTGCEDHGYGTTVIIRHSVTGGYAYTHYSHLSSVNSSILTACGTVDSGRRFRRTCTTPVSITSGIGFASSGNTCYGKTNCAATAHLHFEVKLFNTLGTSGNDSGSFGYVTNSPETYGFRDPMHNLHSVSVLSPAKKVTVPTSGVNLRVGPGGSGGNYYRTFNQPSAGEAFDAVASAPNTSNLDCSQGWYQIVHTDGSRFDDLGDGELPDGWICANFVQQPQTYTLSVLGSGTGTGTVTGSGISCTINNGSTSGTCQASYSSGTNVSLTSTPTGGSTFSGWSGSCSGTGTCNVSMTANKSVTAGFTAPTTSYQLTVSGSGTGTGVVTGSGINCTISSGSKSGTCQLSYSSGTNVSLTATPTNGSTFSGWSGSCSGTGACNLTMSSNKSVTAGFAAQGGDVMLNNGVPYNGTLPPGAQQSVWKYFYFDVAAGSNNLVVTLDNLSEDADLYLRFNNKPDLSNYDCRPYVNGTSTETCNPSSATAGRWWIGVVNYTAQTTISFRIKAAWTTSGTSTAGSFYTVTPCRLLDTRGGSPLVSGSIYEIAIAGICGIPATAKSISANLTVIDATAGGNLVVWPAQTSKPNTSNISFAAGQTRANNTMLLMAPGYYGSAAAVWLQPSLSGSSSTVHVILDVNGYFQ